MSRGGGGGNENNAPLRTFGVESDDVAGSGSPIPLAETTVRSITTKKTLLLTPYNECGRYYAIASDPTDLIYSKTP